MKIEKLNKEGLFVVDVFEPVTLSTLTTVARAYAYSVMTNRKRNARLKIIIFLFILDTPLEVSTIIRFVFRTIYCIALFFDE